MRRLSPFLVLAAASLILGSAASDALAAPRGHGFRGARVGFIGHRHHGFRQAGLKQFRHHGRFGRAALGLGGFWPGYADGYGYGSGATNVAIQHNVANAGGYGYPSLLDLPASTGIRSEPAGQPVIYVIRSRPRLSRHGSPRRVASYAAQGGTASGPRIIEVTAPRGL